MANAEDIVIVGAGIAGLATSLGLHRLGIKSLVLESADSLRITGFAFTMWTNAWRAVDALGIGDVLRPKHNKLNGMVTTSVTTGLTTSELPFSAIDPQGNLDVRCMNRKVLLETMESELPRGTIRYSSKVVHIDNDGCFKSIHLADGTVLKTKVLLGCDGVNSVVARFLGLSKPSFAGRSAFRGFVNFEDGHGFEPKFFEFFGKDAKYGVIPVDDHSVYWFFTYSPSPQGIFWWFGIGTELDYNPKNGAEKEHEEDPTKLKQLILSKLGKVPDEIREVFEKTELRSMVGSPLRFRHPWELIWAKISKDNVCVLGDALHPMTPDLGQGACSSLEDSVVLARLLGEALKGKAPNDEKQRNDEGDEHRRIQQGLKKFARERKWRSFDLITTSYFVGFMQQSDGVLMHFLRDKLMANYLPGVLLKKAGYDCGKLTVS